MLARFRGNCPETPAVRGIVQSCPFADGVFDAAVAWGVMFHLKPEDQIKAIESVSRVSRPVHRFFSFDDYALDTESSQG
jgi:SAM-dependent methyltransferase